MKKLIHSLANRYGFSIGRLSQPVPGSDPFLAMQSLLKGYNNPVIFDVGAYHGFIARHFRSLFPDATIYAFEPFCESFQVLKQNTESDANIKAINIGFFSVNGSQQFNCNSSAYTNSLLASDKDGVNTWGEGVLETAKVVEANFQTIDSFVDINKVSHIDILKLDVQGAEPHVMIGASEFCKRKGIRMIYSEIITQPTYSGQKRLDQVLAAFYDQGFDLYNIYNMSNTPEGRLRQVDVIFTLRA
jgi:FkbM family methyltransferase